MEMRCYEKVILCPFTEDIRNHLVMADREFIPPLSSRSSSTQSRLTAASADGIDGYFHSMTSQSSGSRS